MFLAFCTVRLPLCSFSKCFLTSSCLLWKVGTQTVCAIPDAFLPEQHKANVTQRRLPPSLGPWHLTYGEFRIRTHQGMPDVLNVHIPRSPESRLEPDGWVLPSPGLLLTGLSTSYLTVGSLSCCFLSLSNTPQLPFQWQALGRWARTWEFALYPAAPSQHLLHPVFKAPSPK